MAGWLSDSVAVHGSVPTNTPKYGSVYLSHNTIAETGPAMADQARSRVIEDNPIGNGLDTFRALFKSTCEGRGISRARDALDQLDQEGVYIASQPCCTVTL